MSAPKLTHACTENSCSWPSTGASRTLLTSLGGQNANSSFVKILNVPESPPQCQHIASAFQNLNGLSLKFAMATDDVFTRPPLWIQSLKWRPLRQFLGSILVANLSYAVFLHCANGSHRLGRHSTKQLLTASPNSSKPSAVEPANTLKLSPESCFPAKSIAYPHGLSCHFVAQQPSRRGT